MPTAEQIEANYQALRSQRTTRTAAQPSAAAPGYISASETYRPSEVKRRLRLGRDWLADARKKGLKVITEARKILIRGKDLQKYFDSREPE